MNGRTGATGRMEVFKIDCDDSADPADLLVGSGGDGAA